MQAGAAMTQKFQEPKPKPQRILKLQISSPLNSKRFTLIIGIWIFPGAWNLWFGVFPG
jgi:hypothetical protein